jgi:DNA polymerase III subunit epsilon
VFDTETTGLPRFCRGGLPKTSDLAAYSGARVVSLAWLSARRMDHTCLGEGGGVIRPEGFVIPADAARIHGITTERALAAGQPFGAVLSPFVAALGRCVAVAGHNVDFDVHVLGAEFLRRGWTEAHDLLLARPRVCTMRMGKSLLNLPRNPKLGDLYRQLFGAPMDGTLHDASVDTLACYRCLAAMAPAAFEPSEWRIAICPGAGDRQGEVRIELSPPGAAIPDQPAPLFETTLRCDAWSELCGLLKGAWGWARRRFPEAEIVGCDMLRRGSAEFRIE